MVHIPDVFFQGDESVFVLVDVVQRLLNDDVLHVLRFLRMEEVREFRLCELVILVAVGGHEAILVPGDHFAIVEAVAAAVHGFGTQESVGHVQIFVPRQQRVVVQLVTVPLPFHILVNVTFLRELDPLLQFRQSRRRSCPCRFCPR